MSNSTEVPKKKRKRRTADVPLFTELDTATQKLIEISLRRLCKQAMNEQPSDEDERKPS